MGIEHRADSGFRKFSALSKVRFGRTIRCFEMPYVSYPRPLYAISKLRTLFRIFVFCTLCQSMAFACICPDTMSLKELQEHEFEKSNNILIIDVLEIDRKDDSFSFKVLEVIKGRSNSIKILNGVNNGYCGPSVLRTGKWLVYGNLGTGNILSINPCGLTRSFEHPEYNVYAGHKPPPPPPSEQSALEEKIKHQQSLEKWRHDNVAPAKKNLEEEIISLRKREN